MSSKQAGGLVPLDSALVQEVVDSYLSFLERILSSNSMFLGERVFAEFEAVTVSGESVDVELGVNFSGALRKSLSPKAGGYFEYDPSTGRRSVYVNLNPFYQGWGTISSDQKFRDSLQDTLEHELTHALDANVESVDNEDPDSYYNSDSELRAYARGIYSEVLRFFASVGVQVTDSLRVKNLAFRRGLEKSKRFQQMKSHLTAESLKSLVSKVYSELEADGFF